MKRLFFLIGLLWLWGSLAAAGQEKRECPDTETNVNFFPDQLIVVFYKGTDPQRIREIHESLNVEVLDSILRGQINVIKVPPGKSLQELCRKYLDHYPEVEAINLNYTSIRPLEDTQ